MLSLIPVLVTFNRVSERYYPVIVITAALALLLHTSLISMYIWGADINKEYYYASLTKNNSFWDSSISHPYSAMTSIGILAPIVSLITGVDLTWIFKIVFPAIFSFVPLVLYQIFKRQTEPKTAFLASFFFMSIFTFFTELNSVARQQIAELFFALIILLFISKHDINPRKRVFLLSILFFALATAHYALTIILIITLGFSLLFISSTKNITSNPSLNKILTINGKINFRELGQLSKENKKQVSLWLLLCITAFTWYLYIANSAVFIRLEMVFLETINGIRQFLNPALPRGGTLIVRETVSPIHDITKILQLLMQFFITAGIIKVMVTRNKKTNLDKEYIALALSFFLLSLAAVAFPYISSFLNTTRLYQIILLILSPFCIIGGIALIQLFSKSIYTIFRKGKMLSKDLSFKSLAFFLTVFLLFNSGLIYELTNDHPNSIALSQNSILTNGTISEKIQLYNTITSTEEVSGATWLRMYRSLQVKTYADFDCRQDLLLAYAFIPEGQSEIVYNTTEKINAHSYFFFRKLNLIEGVMGGAQKIGHSDSFNSTYIRSQLLHHSNLVYSNSGSEIYLTLRSVTIKHGN